MLGAANFGAAQIKTCQWMPFLRIIRSPMRPIPFIALFALLLCGCANVEYTAYSGGQQNWPVASGSFVQRNFDLPVYLGPPDKPYRVLGYTEVESAPLRSAAVWREGWKASKPACAENDLFYAASRAPVKESSGHV